MYAGLKEYAVSKKKKKDLAQNKFSSFVQHHLALLSMR